VKLEPLKKTASYWAGRGNKMHAHRERPEWRGHEGRICEVLQEDRCSSMYSNYYRVVVCNVLYSRIVCYFLHPGILIRNIDWCLFS
jgi:hypothetical protein